MGEGTKARAGRRVYNSAGGVGSFRSVPDGADIGYTGGDGAIESVTPIPLEPVTLPPALNPTGAERMPLYEHYSDELGEAIAAYYSEGMSLHAISRVTGMPAYATLLKWVKNNGVFRDKLDGARIARALHFESKAIDEADAATDAKDTPAQRLKYDAAVWAASVNDPERYGKRTTIQGDMSRPLQFVIMTGVPAPSEDQKPPELGEDGVIEVPSQVVTQQVDSEHESTQPLDNEQVIDKEGGDGQAQERAGTVG